MCFHHWTVQRVERTQYGRAGGIIIAEVPEPTARSLLVTMMAVSFIATNARRRLSGDPR
jgi:hypothetical protein